MWQAAQQRRYRREVGGTAYRKPIHNTMLYCLTRFATLARRNNLAAHLVKG